MDRSLSPSKFATLGAPRHIWAIPALHGQTESLIALHNKILRQFQCGDRILYLGNYIGYGPDSAGTIAELLTFRRMVLCTPGVVPHDLIYLRGSQEEIWQKLLQLQFAPDPSGLLLWMLSHGLAPTLESYGLDPHDGIHACNQGVVGITKWTQHIIQRIKSFPGHDILHSHMVRAAYTDMGHPRPLLFVHAGLDYERDLDSQGDSFWWESKKFSAINERYEPFDKIIRGYDPDHGGCKINGATATIDHGCGFGGPLVCTGFADNGDMIESFEIAA